MTAAVRASGLTKRYGDTVALDEVSIRVAAGEVFALVGPNGAGKTTLVQTLTGTKAATEGDISVLGQLPTAVDPAAIGLLPQSFGPQDRLSVRELLDAYAGLYDDTLPVESVLEDVGIAGKAQSRYETLSGGEKRRVCVGIALINDPELLFLDEPTTGIDPAGRRTLWQLLESLADGGTTIVLTTHYMAEAERLADHVGLLDDGHLVALDTPRALIDAHGGATRLAIDVEGSLPTDVELGYATSRRDGQLVVRDVGPTEIGAVVDRLTAAGVEPESLSWREPDLEDVYLDLTGTAVGYGGDAVDPGELDATGPLATDGGSR